MWVRAVVRVEEGVVAHEDSGLNTALVGPDHVEVGGEEDADGDEERDAKH